MWVGPPSNQKQITDFFGIAPGKLPPAARASRASVKVIPPAVNAPILSTFRRETPWQFRLVPPRGMSSMALILEEVGNGVGRLGVPHTRYAREKHRRLPVSSSYIQCYNLADTPAS
jgi:hypothetical protein